MLKNIFNNDIKNLKEIDMAYKRTKKDDKYNVVAIEKAIEIVGGAERLARKLDISYQAVRNWQHGFAVPNILSCVKIEKITDGNVKREDILPDYPWDELR
jgi:DNA-binding transcriptional regulator YdaS (Cro superfamily)